MKKNPCRFISLLFALTSSLLHINSVAGEDTTFDTHVHGVSELTITIEKQQLEIEMISPAINIVGFEHRAITKKEQAIIRRAELRLSKHEDMFTFTGKNCVLTNQVIDTSSLTTQHQEKNNWYNDSYKYNLEHLSEKNMRADIGHYEVIARYSYRCIKTSTLPIITVTIFDLFSGISQINTRWLTDTRQGSSMLNINNQVINFR